MARRRKGRYPNEFRRMAVERLKRCENIVALSEELGVHRRLLYKWRDQLDPVDIGEEPPPENPRESTLRKEISQLKRLLVPTKKSVLHETVELTNLRVVGCLGHVYATHVSTGLFPNALFCKLR